MGLEPFELWMAPVPPSPALKDLLSEQRLSPKRYQSPGIQVFGMKGPESHTARLSGRQDLKNVEGFSWGLKKVSHLIPGDSLKMRH